MWLWGSKKMLKNIRWYQWEEAKVRKKSILKKIKWKEISRKLVKDEIKRKKIRGSCIK